MYRNTGVLCEGFRVSAFMLLVAVLPGGNGLKLGWPRVSESAALPIFFISASDFELSNLCINIMLLLLLLLGFLSLTPATNRSLLSLLPVATLRPVGMVRSSTIMTALLLLLLFGLLPRLSIALVLVVLPVTKCARVRVVATRQVPMKTSLLLVLFVFVVLPPLLFVLLFLLKHRCRILLALCLSGCFLRLLMPCW